MLNDRESFRERITSGILDLNVQWSVDGEVSGDSEGVVPAPIKVTEDDPSGAATFTPRLPGTENNPAYVWLRTTCPDPALPATALQVELSYENGGVIIGPTSLLSFADTLRNGIPLDPDGDAQVALGDQACLSSDKDFDLRFRWWLDDDFSDEAKTSFAFEFVGRQCRHANGRTNPFDSVESCNAGHAISFLAFGTDSEVADTEIDPAIHGVNSSDEDGPVSVDWKTAVEVDYVVAYFGSTLGPQMTIYDHRDQNSKTQGIATAGDPGAAISAYDVQKSQGGPSEAAKPCEVADRLLDGNDSFSLEATTKLEYSESNSWTEEGE